MASKAFSYIRWSSRRQSDGDSLRRQLEAAVAYAAEHGLDLDTTHRDAGVSGARGKNRLKGSLSRFLAKVEAGEIARGSYLLVENLDRLTREDVETAMSLFLNLTKAGITIVTLGDGKAYSSATIRENWTDLIVTMMVMVRAHEENQIKGKRVWVKHQQSKERARTEGYAWTASGPCWLKRKADKTGWDEVPERAATVRRIMDWFDGGLGTTKIALRLNAEGVKPFKGGKCWSPSTVRDLARSRTLIGEYQPCDCRDQRTDRYRPKQGDPVPDYYPEVIDRAQFHRVQAMLDTKAFGKGRGPSTVKFNNLFQGFSVCAECKGVVGFHRDDARGKSVLRCVGATRGDCTNRTRYAYPDLERVLIESVNEFNLTPPTNNKERLRLEALTGERAECEVQSQRLVSLVMKGNRTAEAMEDANQARLAVIEAEIASLKRGLEQGGWVGHPADRKAAVARLRADLEGKVGEDLYDARARLSSALRAVIDEVRFEPRGPRLQPAIRKTVDLDGLIQVRVKGGHYYWFRDGAFVSDIDVRKAA